MSISYFPIAFLMLKPLPLNKIILISKRTIQFSLPLLIVEAYFRLMNPIWQPSEFVDYNTENLFFYAFKINSDDVKRETFFFIWKQFIRI